MQERLPIIYVQVNNGAVTNLPKQTPAGPLGLPPPSLCGCHVHIQTVPCPRQGQTTWLPVPCPWRTKALLPVPTGCPELSLASFVAPVPWWRHTEHLTCISIQSVSWRVSSCRKTNLMALVLCKPEYSILISDCWVQDSESHITQYNILIYQQEEDSCFFPEARYGIYLRLLLLVKKRKLF